MPKVAQQSAFKQKKKTGERKPSLCAPVTAVICGLCRWYFLYNYSQNVKKETPTTTIYPKARLLPCCGFTVASERAPPFPHLNNSTKTVPSSPLRSLQKEGGGSRLRSRNRKLSLVRRGGKVSSKTWLRLYTCTVHSCIFALFLRGVLVRNAYVFSDTA